MNDKDRKKAIDDTLAELLKVDAKDRIATLRKRFSNIPTEIREEVESLVELDLQADQNNDAFRPIEQMSLIRMLPTDLHPDCLLGRELGPYRITERLGSGGFATVYAAIRTTPFEQRVAIKMIRPEYSFKADWVQRFATERQLLADLNHPYIGRLLDGSHNEEGLPYFVMEFIDGTPIDVFCNQRKLSVEDRLKLFIEVCAATTYANQLGIIHRDLKPANIMVTPEGVPKLVDFGIAKLIRETVEDAEALSATGFNPMTVRYASPEQIRGGPVGISSDVYSLGIVLYELLTGQNPYGLTDESVYHNISTAIVDRIPDQPSDAVQPRTSKSKDVERSITNIVAPRSMHRRPLSKELRGDLDNIVMKAIRKDPERRYSTTAELATDIKRYIEGHPVIARGESFSYSAKKYVQRNLALVLLTFALASVVAISVATLTWQQYGRAIDREQAKMERILRTATIPAIERFIAEDRFVDALRIVESAIIEFPGDAQLLKLLEQSSRQFEIESVPQGASVYTRPVAFTDQKWQLIGVTPFKRNLPKKGGFHFKIKKDGYDPLIVLRASTKPVFYLSESDSSYDDMVSVGPQRSVDLPAWGKTIIIEEAYYIDRFEVTNRQYQRFVEANDYDDPRYWSELIQHNPTASWPDAIDEFCDATGKFGPSTWSSGTFPPGQDDYPVRGVSWYEAAAYARYVGKELPTIYHWFGAADVYDQSLYIIPNSNIQNRSSGPKSVGSFFGIGPYGTYDMAGNVREWCWNSSEDSNRYILGGSWDQPDYMFREPAVRNPFERDADFGFRCMRSGSRNDSLFAEMKLDTRDFENEPAIPDDRFDYIKNIHYRYDKPRKPEGRVVRNWKDDKNRRCQKVAFPTAFGDEEVFAYIYYPDENKYRPPYQTIIAFPPSTSLVFGVPKQPRKEQFRESGRVIVRPIVWGTYERRREEFKTAYPREDSQFAHAVRQIALDFFCCIDYLESRGEEFGKLGFYGYSWGAAIGPILLALDDRCEAAVFHCGGLARTRAYKEADQITFVPRMHVPVLMINGRYDAIFPPKYQRLMFDKFPTKPGIGKEHLLLEWGHYVPNRIVEAEAVKWFDRFLGRPQSADRF